jgi:hypothetical protein
MYESFCRASNLLVASARPSLNVTPMAGRVHPRVRRRPNADSPGEIYPRVGFIVTTLNCAKRGAQVLLISDPSRGAAIPRSEVARDPTNIPPQTRGGAFT